MAGIMAFGQVSQGQNTALVQTMGVCQNVPISHMHIYTYIYIASTVGATPVSLV